MAKICCVLQVVLFTVLWFKWLVEKHCVVRVLLEIRDTTFYEINCHYNSDKFSYKFAFILFCSFQEIKDKNQVFSKLLVWYFHFLFIANSLLFQSHVEFNRLLKRDFLACYSCSHYSPVSVCAKHTRQFFTSWINSKYNGNRFFRLEKKLFLSDEKGFSGQKRFWFFK